MQAEYLNRRFEIKDDLHRLISGIELSRSLKTEEKTSIMYKGIVL